MKLRLLMRLTFTFFRRHRLEIIAFLAILVAHWTNTFHTNFPDEFDNIVGGWYITQGRLPYIGFFSHHNPGAYVIAALITLFTGQSLVWFRMVWALVLFFSLLGSYLYLRRSIGERQTRFYLGFAVVWALTATYFWGHMLLSETVVAYTLVPAFGLILLKSLHRLPFSRSDVIFISATTAIALFTSLTFTFTAVILLAFFFLRIVRQTGLFSRFTLFTLVILAAPYLFFLLYLILTSSLSEFYYQSIFYNREYYIYNFPTVAGQVSKHPARYMLSIFYNTSNQFHSLLLQVRDFNFAFPVNISLLLGNVGFILYLLVKRKFTLAAVVYLTLTFMNARGEPLTSKETDFHSTVYAMTSLFNLSLILFTLVKAVNEKTSAVDQLFQKAILVLLSVYAFFMTAALTRSYGEKVYTKLMGQATGIYDAPVAAPIINKIVSPNDYFWIGPFEFQELLYINGKLPSKYHWFLPAHARSEKIKTEIIRDLEKNRPKLIVFKESLGYFESLPADFNYPIVNFLRANYFRLIDLETDGQKYVPLITGLHNFDIAENFYFDKRRRDEIVMLLLEQGIVAKQEL